MHLFYKLIQTALFVCFCSSAVAANVIIDEKPAAQPNALQFYGETAPIVSEEQLQSDINSIKQALINKNKNATIYIRYAFAEVANSDTDIYVSLGNCFENKDRQAIVSYTKCSESIKYKFVGITVDPKGFGALNSSYLYYRVVTQSEVKILAETKSKDMTKDFLAAAMKDKKLFDTVKTNPYPSVFCSSLEKMGYNPSFNDEEKAIIKQCLKLN